MRRAALTPAEGRDDSMKTISARARTFSRLIIMTFAAVSLVSLTTPAIAQVDGEQRNESHSIRAGQLAGVFLTAFGAATTLSAIVTTPWEHTDAADWRTGLLWGVGLTSLIAGVVVWAITGRRARGGRRQRDEPEPAPTLPSYGEPAAPLILERLTPEIQRQLNACTVPLLGQLETFNIGVSVGMAGAVRVTFSRPRISQSILSCLNDTFSSIRLGVSTLERSARLSISVPYELEQGEDELEQDESAEGDSDVPETTIELENETEPGADNPSRDQVTESNDEHHD